MGYTVVNRGIIMTLEEIEKLKYVVCCPVCDNKKCVKDTDKCEAEIWKRRKLGGGEDGKKI